MLARPTTDRVLEGIIASIEHDVLPTMTDERARVAVQMIQQLLHSAAVRAAHEIAWMAEEVGAIREAATRFAGNTAVAVAMTALDDLGPAGLHLADAQARYDAASEVLSRMVEAAYTDGTADDRAVIGALLAARSEHEMAVVGQLDLVGRG